LDIDNWTLEIGHSSVLSARVAMKEQYGYHWRMENGIPTVVKRENEKQDHMSGAAARLFMRAFCVACAMGVLCLFPLQTFSQEAAQPSPSESAEAPVLKEAVMCESLKDGLPVNAGVVFSIEIGRIFCLTSFLPGSRRIAVHHKWFHRGQLTNNQRLWIHAPLWATASSIQLREADKGPWQMEISDNSGEILKVLRFSVVD
jgi:hypothetical protein